MEIWHFVPISMTVALPSGSGLGCVGRSSAASGQPGQQLEVTWWPYASPFSQTPDGGASTGLLLLPVEAARIAGVEAAVLHRWLLTSPPCCYWLSSFVCSDFSQREELDKVLPKDVVSLAQAGPCTLLSNKSLNFFSFGTWKFLSHSIVMLWLLFVLVLIQALYSPLSGNFGKGQEFFFPFFPILAVLQGGKVKLLQLSLIVT